MVDLPLPERPISAVCLLAGITRSHWSRTVISGLDGYAKETFLNSIVPSGCGSRTPSNEVPSMSDLRSMSTRSFS